MQIIATQLHGFKKNICTTNLLKSLDFFTKVLSQKDHYDIIFLDFEKAFDKEPHKRLLLKLPKYGVSGKLLNWFEAFLKNRRQGVVLGDSVSDWNDIQSGGHHEVFYQFEDINFFFIKFSMIIKKMKIIFSKNAPKDVAKIQHLI